MRDLTAKRFVGAPGGGVDFGFVNDQTATAIGVRSGPIRLQNAYEGPKGYGFRHVAGYPDRIKQMQGLGYTSFVSFAFVVSQNYQKIGRGERGRLVLIYRTLGYDLRLVVGFDEEFEGFWSIITGLPYRVASCPIIYEVTRPGGSEPTPGATGEPLRFATSSLPGPAKTGGNGS